MKVLEFLEKTAQIDELMGDDTACVNLPRLYRRYREVCDEFMTHTTSEIPQEIIDAQNEIRSAIDECLYNLAQIDKRYEEI